jgi:uncharacterized damage-inducible protein DinB
MQQIWKTIMWQQLGAAVDMLENAIRACPEDLWEEKNNNHSFWYIAYHTLFFLDFYMSEKEEGFQPPAPFTLSELDPSGILPERIYTKEELLDYIQYGRKKTKAAIDRLTSENLRERCSFRSPDVTAAELIFYTMRHVQHHAGQLNLMLRTKAGSATAWIKKS